jgi:hypothetical protein
VSAAWVPGCRLWRGRSGKKLAASQVTWDGRFGVGNLGGQGMCGVSEAGPDIGTGARRDHTRRAPGSAQCSQLWLVAGVWVTECLAAQCTTAQQRHMAPSRPAAGSGERGASS